MLPNEILLTILEELDVRSLVLCMQVSRPFQHMVIRTASLQLKLELAKARLIAGPSFGDDAMPSSVHRLEQLRGHQKAWKNLKWSREITIPIQRGGLWELYGGVLAQNTPEHTFVFDQLPSDIRGIPHKTWTINKKFGFRVRDFGMDPTQNLLVLIEKNSTIGSYHIHLQNLRDGTVHPSASFSPIISPQRESLQRPASFAIQIAGDYMGILALSGVNGNELTIWEWKTGKVKLNTTGQQLKAFAFLSDEIVMLAMLTNNRRKAALDLVNFQKTGPERCKCSEIEERVRLRCPSFVGRSITFEDLELRNDPGPLWKETKKVPFCHDPEQSIYVMTMWIIVEGDLGCLLHFIPSTAIKPLSHRRGDIEWENWGLKDTMITAPQGLNSLTWVCYVHGWKYVIEKPRNSETDGFTAYYCDFRPRVGSKVRTIGDAAENEQAPTEEEESEIAMWSEPELASIGNLFRESIGTRIPYVAQEFHLTDVHAHCDVMCAEDNIIIVDDECDTYRILVF